MSVSYTQRTVTLNTKGSLSGPYYSVEFSNDCVNYYTLTYTASLSSLPTPFLSSSVYASMSIVDLPTVGSTASILVPSDACCIKLINLSDNCYGNAYIESICTTTTSTSTSTTTTLSPNCVCYEVIVTSAAPPEGGIAATITYLPCDGGTNINRAFFYPGTYYQCARVIGGLPQIDFVDGTGTISPVGSCNSGPCPPTTTSTTSTSTTSTSTTTPPNFYEIVGYGDDAGGACDSPISSFPMGGNAAGFCTSTVFGSSAWTSIATGNYVISFGGNYQQVSHVFGNAYATVYGAGCTACTTTSTSTTSTTTSTTYNYYNLTRYTCPSCTGPLTGLYGRTTNPTVLTTGYYYNIGDGYVYKVTSSSGGSFYDIDLDGAASSGTNCTGTCGI